MALKENYKDDILDVSVNTKRKYRMTENADGTISLEDETVYTQEGDNFGASDMNATNSKVNTLDANLDGFKFYPTGTDIVGLIADDSAYIDENGNYVIWGTATANQLVADNPNTYKSVPSTEDCRGKVGADSASPFNKKQYRTYRVESTNITAGGAEVKVTKIDENGVVTSVNLPFRTGTFEDDYFKCYYSGGWHCDGKMHCTENGVDIIGSGGTLKQWVYSETVDNTYKIQIIN